MNCCAAIMAVATRPKRGCCCCLNYRLCLIAGLTLIAVMHVSLSRLAAVLVVQSGDSIQTAGLRPFDGPRGSELASDSLKLGGISSRATEGRMLPGDSSVPPQVAADFSPWATTGITQEAQNATIARNRPSKDGMAVHRVTLLDGALLFDEADLEAEVDVGLFDKVRLFITQIHSLVEMVPPGSLPNVAFLMTASSLPYLKDKPTDGTLLSEWARHNAPVFSIAKRVGDGDVLMPNPYFGNLPAWDAEMNKLIRRATKRYPWGKRLAKLHWRGSCSAKFDGVLPRLQLLLKWAGAPGFDIAFSNQCLSRLWAQYKPHKVLSKAEIKQAGSLHKRRVEVEDMGKFKYLLHLPGASSGSYSRSFQYQILAGSAMLKYANPYREFYYSGMREGTHYLTVNISNLGDIVSYLQQHDEMAHALGNAAQTFAASHLSAKSLADYWLALFRTHASFQRFEPSVPPRACICPGSGAQSVAALARAPAQVRRLPRCKLLKCDVAALAVR